MATPRVLHRTTRLLRMQRGVRIAMGEGGRREGVGGAFGKGFLIVSLPPHAPNTAHYPIAHTRTPTADGILTA